MKRGTRNLLIGCGIGCGVLVLIFLVIGGGGFFFVKQMIDKVERIDTATDAVTERFGRIVDYRPAADGTIAPARVEAFLAVRERMAAEREEMDDRLGKLADVESGRLRKRPGEVFQAIRAGVGLIPQIMDFLTARNEALLAEGVPLGEYLYLYTLVYYIDLGRSPADGPPFTLTGDDEEQPERSQRRWDWSADETDDLENDRDDEQEYQIRERRNQRIRRQLNDSLLPMLDHQLEDLATGDDAVDVRWQQDLRREIAAMHDAPLLLPWEDGLPAQTAASLEPFRERLAASYSELCNPLEAAGISQK